jgi:hypothetical protein
VLFAALSFREAHAESNHEPALRLRWQAPPECPPEAEVRGSIDALVGRPRAGAETVFSEVTVLPRVGALWTASVMVRRGALADTRLLTASTCAAISEGAALMIALVIEPESGELRPAMSVEAPAPAAPSPETVDESLPFSPIAPPTQLQPAMVRERVSARAIEGSNPSPFAPLDLGVGPLFIAHAGALPDPSYGVGGELSLSRKHVRLELGAAVLKDGGWEISELPGREARFGLWFVRGEGCAVAHRSSWAPAWCAGLHLGSLSGRARGENVVSREAKLLWLAAATGPSLEWFAGRWVGVLANAELLVPLTRPRFHIDNSPVSYDANPVAGSVQLGAEVIF